MKLTYKQRLFVYAYLGEADGNASEAARIAGYGQPHSAGPRLLADERIRSLISRRVDQAAMSADEVLARLSEFASADIGDYVDEQADGTIKIDLDKARKANRTRVIKKIKVTKRTYTTKQGTEEEQTTELELHSPLVALDKLAQHHGLYRELKANDDRELDKILEDAERAAGATPGPVPGRPGPVQ
jgi:phage terminase small subunit